MNTSVLSVGAGDEEGVAGVLAAAEAEAKWMVIRAGSSGFSVRETVMGIAGL